MINPMSSETSTPMEKYDTIAHVHPDNVRCFVVHVEFNMNTMDSLTPAEKKLSLLLEADRMKSSFIEHATKELNL